MASRRQSRRRRADVRRGWLAARNAITALPQGQRSGQ